MEHSEPQEMGSPNLPACLPFTKTVDDPPTSVPPWQHEHLPQGLQCPAQLSPLLCIPLPLTKTLFDADVHGLGGQQPCPVHMSPSVVIPANSVLQKVNYTFIYMNFISIHDFGDFHNTVDLLLSYHL